MGSSILDHPLISQRYFFPRRFPPPRPFWVDCGDDVRLACHLLAPHADDDALTIVHFHGNGEIVADYLGGEEERFTGLGLNLFLSEYRGYGGSSGVPLLGTMLDDVPRIIEALGLPEQRLLLFGRSVGSIYAIRAAHCFPKVAGLVIESGIAEPLERLLLRVRPDELGVDIDELRQVCTERLDHRRILTGFHRPLLVLHTRHDGLVDCDNARRLHEWAAGPKRLRIFEQGDHNSIMLFNQAEYFAEVENFCTSLGA